MTLEEIIEHYKDSSKSPYHQLGFSRQRWHEWKKRGYIPLRTQFEIEQKTEGALKADASEYLRYKKRNLHK